MFHIWLILKLDLFGPSLKLMSTAIRIILWRIQLAKEKIVASVNANSLTRTAFSLRIEWCAFCSVKA